MISNKGITQKGADNANPDKHVVSIYANVIPSAVDPAPDLQHISRLAPHTL